MEESASSVLHYFVYFVPLGSDCFVHGQVVFMGRISFKPLRHTLYHPFLNKLSINLNKIDEFFNPLREDKTMLAKDL